MKFGIFYEHQLPRPWTERSEYELLQNSLVQIELADKLAVTRHLSGAGANIQELNSVRKQLSRIKGGRLARACRAGRHAEEVDVTAGLPRG